MKFADSVSKDNDTLGGGAKPPCNGLTPDALPEVQKPVLAENSQTGVSTRNARSGTDGTASGEAKLAVTIPSRNGRRIGNSTDGTASGESKLAVTIPSRDGRRIENSTDDKTSGEAKPAVAIPRCEGGRTDGSTPLKTIKRKSKDVPHWYALRVTYGREKKAYDYLVRNHVEAYYPTIKTVKEVDGKRKTVEESRLPNIFFARGTEEEIKSFVYDNEKLPHLRFYYRHTHEGAQLIKEPLIVPDYQIEGLKIISTSEADDVIIVPSEIQKFQTGQTVRVIDGVFKGVIGKVARYHGQQRVAITIDGLLTIASAYVPSAFLERIL